MAAAFALWYVAVIAQSFAHPAIAVVAVYLAALTIALARHPQLARVVAASGAIASLACGAGMTGTTLLAAVGLVAAVGLSRWGDLAIAIAAAVLAGVSVAGAQTAILTLPVVYIAQFWVSVLVSIAAGAAAVLLVALSYVRRQQSAAAA